jgi:hypothetical protein
MSKNPVEIFGNAVVKLRSAMSFKLTSAGTAPQVETELRDASRDRGV